MIKDPQETKTDQDRGKDKELVLEIEVGGTLSHRELEEGLENETRHRGEAEDGREVWMIDRLCDHARRQRHHELKQTVIDNKEHVDDRDRA